MTKKTTKAKAPKGTAAIDQLAEDPGNPRSITEDRLRGLGAAVETFGDLSGIVWNETTGQLVAGHQRVKALRAAGATTWVRTGPDAGAIEHPVTKERFPVRVVRWDEEKQRAANLTANNTEIQGTWDTAKAMEQLASLSGFERFESVGLGDLGLAIGPALEAVAAVAPEEFPEVSPGSVTVTYCCPKCSYKWSGSPDPAKKLPAAT